jgi:molybdopterin converting factor subunit 1
MRMMDVEVRLFAVLAERAGSASVQIELEEGATVRDAIDAVSRRPGLRDPLDRLKVVMAVNREYAGMDVVLKEGDELALIPPVSGGASKRPLGVSLTLKYEGNDTSNSRGDTRA